MSEIMNTNEQQIQNAIESSMKKKKKKKRITSLIVILAIIVVAVIAIAVSGNSPDEDTTPVMTVTADQIIGDYKSNKVTAEGTYKDKYVKITDCTVKNINDGHFFVEAKDEDLWLEEISVNYTNDQKDTVTQLKEGDVVTVTGKITGTTAFDDIRIENAKIEK